MDEFKEALAEARKNSRYPHRPDFAKAAHVARRTYEKYEAGDTVPSEEYLERIILHCSISTETADRLRRLRTETLARRAGVPVGTPFPDLNVSELAERIQKEIEYELKRAGVKLMPSTKRVCARRIAMILNTALRKT
jgi:transcriptional regulator with XRE-family HTH domain